MHLKFISPIIGSLFLCLNIVCAQDNQWTSARPDGHAPISVMGDHMHHKGEVMFSYRFMAMSMSGSLEGNADISNEEIYNNYMIAPQDMQMNMHMLGAMYAPTDKITLMLMGNYISNSMDLTTKTDVNFETKSSGIADIKLSVLFKLMNKKRQSLHGNIGISIPAGSIDARDATPMSDDAQLAYPMQLGSGTWDPSLALTYLIQGDKISGGSQLNYTYILGNNSESYSLGNKVKAAAWGAYNISNSISMSTSLTYLNASSIDGSDPDLNPIMMPLFDSSNSGRSQLDFGIGANYSLTNNRFSGLRFAVEYQLPIMQNTTGIQMKNTSMLTIGAQYAISH